MVDKNVLTAFQRECLACDVCTPALLRLARLSMFACAGKRV
jgi:hypothetical protein